MFLYLFVVRGRTREKKSMSKNLSVVPAVLTKDMCGENSSEFVGILVVLHPTKVSSM